MKKLFSFASLLSVLLLLSCSNFIGNKNTSVRVILPKAENNARTIGISYDLSDVEEYILLLEGNNFNETYTCEPGDDLLIEDINPGEYKLTGYANDANGNCIAYGVTVAIVTPFIENSCELILKKNILTNIATVVPTRTKESIELSSSEEIDVNALINDIQLKVTYLSGYETNVCLSEITDIGYFFVKTYLVYDEETKVETNILDYAAKKLVLEVCMYDCDFNEFVNAQNNEDLIQALSEKQIPLFEFSYSLELSSITFQIYDDEDTIKKREETFDAKNDIEFEEPEARSGFEFAGWYYYNGSTEVEKLEDNKILISNLSKYLDAEGCIKGKWKLVDLTVADLLNFNSANYPNGFTLKLDDSNFTNDEEGYSALKRNLYLKKEYNSDLLINLDMYECNIDCFGYQSGNADFTVTEYVYFENCINLRLVKLPKSILMLFNNTFSNCTNLQEVYIPKKFEGSNPAFSGIYNDCKFIVEEGATYVTNVINGVTYDSMLFSVPGRPEEPEYYLYEDCRKVGNKIEIPEGVKFLQNSYNGVNVDNLILPKSLKDINEAFIGAKIKNIEIESGNNNLVILTQTEDVNAYKMLTQNNNDDYGCILLYDCAVTDENFVRTIPDDVTIINTGVYENFKLQQVIIPQTVTEIQANAFKAFDGEIELKNSYTYIDSEGNEISGTLDDPTGMITALKEGKKLEQ